MKDFKSLPKMKTGGRVRKYEAGGGVQSYESAKKEVTPEAKREQTKKMRPPTANESSALDLNRRQYRLGQEWEKLEPKSTNDVIRKESGAPKLQSLSTFKQVPEEARDYEAYKDAGYKRGGKVKRGKTKK